MDFRTRRAIVDDLAQLIALWNAAQLPALELEKQFTEFQVAEDAEGKLVGAVGMQIVGSEGRIHSETFSDFALADTLRPAFWQRLESVAKNNGLFRLWTQETAPFWKKDAGFAEPSEAVAKTLPSAFTSASSARWITLKLRDEATIPANVDQEFVRFKEAEKQEREKLLRPARALNTLALIIAVLLFIGALVGAVYVFTHRLPQPISP